MLGKCEQNYMLSSHGKTHFAARGSSVQSCIWCPKHKQHLRYDTQQKDKNCQPCRRGHSVTCVL